MLVRPRMPEQHRHTPSLKGGMLRKGKGEKKQSGTERERQREAEKDWEREERREGVGGLLMSHLH